MVKLQAKHERWLQAARAPAETLVRHGAHYHDAMGQLAGSFARLLLEERKAVGVRAPVTEAAALAGVSRCAYTAKCRLRATKLSRESLLVVHAWSRYLVAERANYREALWVFKRSLLEAAIRLAKGNRLKASRMLDVHRNQLWSIPLRPWQVAQVQFRKVRRRAA